MQTSLDALMDEFGIVRVYPLGLFCLRFCKKVEKAEKRDKMSNGGNRVGITQCTVLRSEFEFKSR